MPRKYYKSKIKRSKRKKSPKRSRPKKVKNYNDNCVLESTDTCVLKRDHNNIRKCRYNYLTQLCSSIYPK